MPIPQVFHSVWLGLNPFPEAFARYRASWLQHFLDWRLQVWDDASDLSWLHNRAVFDRQPTLAGKADVLRYEILLRDGGIYIDTDFECLCPFPHLLDRLDAFSATEDGRIVSIGIMGATPTHPFFRYLVEHLDEWDAEHTRDSQSQRTGPGFMTAMITQYRRNGGQPPRIFGKDLFYPYHFTEPEKRGGPWPDAVAVHHWAKSWWTAPKRPARQPSARAVRVRRCIHQGKTALEVIPYRPDCGCRTAIYPCAIPEIGRCTRVARIEGVKCCQGCDRYQSNASTSTEPNPKCE